jgi:hypothetical protein
MKRKIAVFCGLILLTSIFLIINPSAGSSTEMENTKIISPEKDAEVSGTVTITAEVLACFCNAKTSLYVDNEFVSEGTREEMSKDGNYEVFIHEWDSTTVSDGTHNVKVYGKHEDYSDEINIIVENNGDGKPVENTRIISPEDNAEVKGDVTITAEVLACDCNGLTSLYVDDVFITEGTPGRMTTDGAYQIFIHVWDSTTVSDGTHNVKVVGKHDEYSDEISVIVTNGGSGGDQPPLIKITSPEDNAEVEGVVEIKAEVMACFCDGTTSLYVDDKFISEGTREGMSEDGVYEVFVHEWDSTTVSNGGHKIIVFDKHDDFSRGITVFVNNDGGGTPEKDLKIVSHRNNDQSNGKIIIKAEVKSNDNTGPTSLYINDEFISDGQHLDDIEYEGITYNVYIHEWDSTEVEDGIYTIRVNDNNNAEFDEVQLYVENKGAIVDDKETSPEANDNWNLIRMGIIVLVGTIAIIVLAMKKKNEN